MEVGDRLGEFTRNLGTLQEGYEIQPPPLAFRSLARSFTTSKTRLMVKTGIRKPQIPLPGPSVDHHTYLCISPHALIPSYTPVMTKERHVGIIYC